MRANLIVGVIVGTLVFVTLQFLLPAVACRDGWRSPSIGHRGACSYHGGADKGGIWPLLVLGTSIAAGVYTSKIAARKSTRTLIQNDIDCQDQAFASEINDIRFAIQNGKRVEFFYKGLKDSTYHKRIIRPIELNRIAHHYDRNYTVCLKGYCEMRKADRNFALKRMKDLSVI